MKIMAIETATEACSAALYLDGEVCSRYEFAPQKHAELILPMVDELLSSAGIKLNNLDCLAFGRGPGAFTGVRIATGVIQGLAYGANLPVAPISTLAVLAQGAVARGEYLFSAIDARMGEIYWCMFQVRNNLVVPITSESVGKPDQVTIPVTRSWFGVGSGWKTYGAVLGAMLGEHLSGQDGDSYPHARDIIPLAISMYEAGEVVTAEQALPVYLRNKVTG